MLFSYLFSNIVNFLEMIATFLWALTNETIYSLNEQAYNAFVRPLLKYSSLVWDLHCRDEIETLEEVQKCAARWVIGRFRRTSQVAEIARYCSGLLLNRGVKQQDSTPYTNSSGA
jgi:hypothetical protein